MPSTTSGAKLVHDLALEFRRLGHEPFVVSTDEFISKDAVLSREEGIDVLRVKAGRIKTAPRLLLRAWNEIRLSQILWKRGKEYFEARPCDLVVYYSPTIFFGPLVKRLKELYSCPAYLVLRDIFPQWAVDAGVLKKGAVYRYFKYRERQNYEAADIIGVQSPSNLKYFRDQGLDGQYRLEVLYNWASLQEEDIPRSNYRDRLGLQDKVVFFYGGNIGVAQDMDNIVRLAENLRDEPSAFFLLVGDGSEVPRLKEQIAARSLTNITVHGAVAQQEYLSMLSEFDIGLISLDRGLTTQNIPGKLLGYLYHSMPTLASVNPGNDLKDLLERNRAGMACFNGDDTRLAEQARQLLHDARLRRELGRNARALLENTFSVERAGSQILGHFEGDH